MAVIWAMVPDGWGGDWRLWRPWCSWELSAGGARAAAARERACCVFLPRAPSCMAAAATGREAVLGNAAPLHDPSQLCTAVEAVEFLDCYYLASSEHV